MIRLAGVSKRFGRRLALDAFDLSVAGGEVVALIGPNGAGKSTALRILAGVLRPSAGAAQIAGHDVQRDGAAARRLLGYLPQRLGVSPATTLGDLAALVAAVRRVAPLDAARALRALGVGDRLGATLAQLSGGERQRAMLALATLGSPAALVLDEPSISLDSDGAEDVRAAIRRARAGGAAVLFASHHLHDVAALADRIVVMVDGRIAAQGTLGELAAAAGVPWTAHASEAPIDRIYRTLVTRRRGDEVAAPPAALRVIRAGAA